MPVYNTLIRIQNPTHQPFLPYYIEYWGNIFGNIILFLPFGYLLKCLIPQKTGIVIIIYGFLVSVFIEIVQFLLQIGVCDIDDVLLNVCGTVAGIILFAKVKKSHSNLK